MRTPRPRGWRGFTLHRSVKRRREFRRLLSMSSYLLFRKFRSFTQRADGIFPVDTDLIAESPLEIILNDEKRFLIMFTPNMIRELVVGFLFTEGLVHDFSEIKECVISAKTESGGEQGFEAKVTLACDRLRTFPGGSRVSYSSCGICGTDNYADLERGLHRVKGRHKFSMDFLGRLASRIEEFQPLYKRTGGSHAAVIFDRSGKAISSSEDMGRHNALDKVIGSTVIHRIPCHDKVVISSGRASLEMIVKAVRAAFPVFVAMSRPTSKAVQAARHYNVTLVDMAKDSNRIYSHGRRIQGY